MNKSNSAVIISVLMVFKHSRMQYKIAQSPINNFNILPGIHAGKMSNQISVFFDITCYYTNQ